LRAKGFSCSLGVLYRGPGIYKLHFLIKKIYKKISALHFFQFLVIKPLDPEPDPDPKLEKMLDPDMYPDLH
jgi:hypothetical protein